MSSVTFRPPTYAPNTTTMGPVLQSQPFISELHPLIGPPLRSITVNPGFNIRKEFTTVAEDHEGRVQHLGVFLGNLFAETENQFVFSLFELKQFGDMNWMTSTWQFDSYIAQETPSQVPPPLGSYKKNQQSGTLTRFAFGVQTLLDTLKDPDGDMIYYAMTIQCIQSFVRAMEALVLTSMVNTRAQYLAFWTEASDFYVNVQSRATTDAVTWDAMHRYEDAASRLLDIVQNAFAQSHRGRATAVIVHQGFRSLVAASPKLTDNYLRGNGNQDFADSRADAIGLQGTLLGTNVRLYVSAPINATGQGVFMDPLSRVVEIGGYGMLDNFGWNLEIEKYRSTMTDTSMFSMPDDNFKTITMLEALDRCGRFDASPNGNLVPLHKELATNARSIATRNKLAIVDGQVDMFVYKTSETTWSNVTHYGHMDNWALTPTIIRNHARTMRMYLERRLTNEQLAGIKTGTALIARLNGLQIRDVDLEFARLAQGYTITNVVSPGHFTGGANLPTNNEVANGSVQVKALANYEPRFFGYPNGLFVLASVDRAQHTYIAPYVFETARDYFDGVRAAYKVLQEIYGNDHPMLDPSYCPTFLKSYMPGSVGAEYDGYTTFAHNVLANNAQPILLATIAPQGQQNAPAGYAGVRLTGANAKFNTYLEEGVPMVREVFATDGTITAFGDKFNSGKMGVAYRRYVAEKNARSQTPNINVAPIADAFSHFLDNEVVTRLKRTPQPAANASQAVQDAYVLDNDFDSFAFNKILAHVIQQTNRDSDYTFAKEQFDALASQQGFAAYKATADKTSAPGAKTYYLTRLVASPTRVFEYQRELTGVNNAAGQPITKEKLIQIASSLNQSAASFNAAAVNTELRQQQRYSPDDLASRVISSQSRQTPQRTEARMPTQLGTGTAPATAFADIGVDVVIDQLGRAQIKTNKNLAERVNIINKEPDVLLRVGALMLVYAPVQKKPIQKMYDENIVMPVSMLLARPRRRYRTVAMIWLAMNDKIGMAAFALPDVRRGIDASRKSMFDHWSMYLGAVVIDPARIMLMPDVCIVGYEGGEAVDPVYPPRLDMMTGGQQNLSTASGCMYYICMPAGACWGRESVLSPTMDLRGRFPHQLSQFAVNDQASIDFLQKSKPHYPSALYTCALYQLEGTFTRALPTDLTFQAASKRKNTIISRELALVNLIPGQTIAVPPADHMGKNVYAGVARQRVGGAFPEIVHADPHAHTHFLTE